MSKTNRPILLDLFSGAGGAAVGYHRAGFDVLGVDINPQPRYPYPFMRADALLLDPEWIRTRFDAIHASPPCQAHSSMKHAPNGKDHVDLIPQTRALLRATRLPFVIENVVGARLENPTTLCGSMFGLGAGGFQLRRHREFEASFDLGEVPKCNHTTPVIGVYGGHVRCRASAYWRHGGGDFPDADRKRLASLAMGIDHMTMMELSQAIPPAYTEWIGARMMEAVHGQETISV